jgi:hypothetical protein
MCQWDTDEASTVTIILRCDHSVNDVGWFHGGFQPSQVDRYTLERFSLRAGSYLDNLVQAAESNCCVQAFVLGT